MSELPACSPIVATGASRGRSGAAATESAEAFGQAMGAAAAAAPGPAILAAAAPMAPGLDSPAFVGRPAEGPDGDAFAGAGETAAGSGCWPPRPASASAPLAGEVAADSAPVPVPGFVPIEPVPVEFGSAVGAASGPAATNPGDAPPRPAPEFPERAAPPPPRVLAGPRPAIPPSLLASAVDTPAALQTFAPTLPGRAVVAVVPPPPPDMRPVPAPQTPVVASPASPAVARPVPLAPPDTPIVPRVAPLDMQLPPDAQVRVIATRHAAATPSFATSPSPASVTMDADVPARQVAEEPRTTRAAPSADTALTPTDAPMRGGERSGDRAPTEGSRSAQGLDLEAGAAALEPSSRAAGSSDLPPAAAQAVREVASALHERRRASRARLAEGDTRPSETSSRSVPAAPVASLAESEATPIRRREAAPVRAATPPVVPRPESAAPMTSDGAPGEPGNSVARAAGAAPAATPSIASPPTEANPTAPRDEAARGGRSLDAPARTESSDAVLKALESRDAREAKPRDAVTLRFDGEHGLEGRLRLAVRGESLRATLHSSDPGTLQRLGGGLEELRRSLAEHGFDDARIALHDTRPAAEAARMDAPPKRDERDASRRDSQEPRDSRDPRDRRQGPRRDHSNARRSS